VFRLPFLQLTSSTRFSVGSRALETHIYKPGSYPFDLIAPVAVIWQPLPCVSTSAKDHPSGKAQASKDSGSGSQKKAERRKKKGKGKEKDVEANFEPTRKVWLRSHPSVFNDVFSSLQTAASTVLDVVKRNMREDEKHVDVELTDLRGQVNVFEIMGPKSSQVLKGALSPVPQDQSSEFHQVNHLLFFC
jgi:ribonuclease P/MRP protein subunit POP1